MSQNDISSGKMRVPSADFTRYTEGTVDETVTAIVDAAKLQGFRVMHIHDIASSMHNAGFASQPYAVVELCRADIAHGVLLAEPRFGAFLPCRIAVYAQGGETVLTTVLPSNLLAFFPTNDDIAAAARHVDSLLEKIIEQAAS